MTEIIVEVPSPTVIEIGSGQGGARGPQGTQGTQGTQGFAGGGIYTYSELPPENPIVGDRWLCLLNGYEYTWLDDGDSQQWVDTRTSGFLGPIGAQGTTGIGTQGVQGIQGAQGIQGTEGLQGSSGTSVLILGSYPDYESLIAAHPSGTPGDAYLVDGNLYVWLGA